MSADGKIMLGKYETLHEVNWDNLVSRVGRDRFQSLIRDARLIGLVNWTMLTHMTAIWQKLASRLAPKLTGEKPHLGENRKSTVEM